MVNYILTSLLLHSILLVHFATPDSVNTSSPLKVEVNIVEKVKSGQNSLILPTLRKYADRGRDGGHNKKEQKVDMTDYANRLKAAIDPVWYNHIKPYQSKLKKQYITIVLLFPDIHGNVINVRIIKASGNPTLDALALQTFREVKQIPIPPESLVKDGIEWDFTVGERN